MKPSTAAVLLASLAAETLAGTIVWDGNFDYYNTVADFDTWSWSNEVGEYQNYIHGSAGTAEFLALDPSYKNPADTKESHGLKLTINGDSKWSNFQRTELIPQTTANLGTGVLYYHFSMKRGQTNGPTTSEHQLNFFESHFTEIKVGVGSDLTALQWCVNSTPQWSTPFTADVWNNFAYEIDFSAHTVALWWSTGGNPLTKVMSAVSAGSTSTNSADWHLGGLRLTDSTAVEEYYFSGVYIEQAPITTSIGSGSTGTTSAGSTSQASSTTSKASSTSSTSKASSTSSTSSSTSASPTSTGCQSAKWGQCGGQGWTGCTACVSGSTCTYSNPYYSQCL